MRLGRPVIGGLGIDHDVPMLWHVSRLIRQFLAWVAPPPPESDAATRAEAAHTMLAQARHLSNVLVVLAPPTALSWVALLWTRADRIGLLVWLAMIVIADIGVYWAGRDRRTTEPVDQIERRMGRALVRSGIAWGSLPLLAMSADTSWVPLVGMMVLATMAANAIFSSAIRRLFWSYQLSVVSVSVFGMWIRSGTDALVVIIVLIYATPFSAVLADIGRANLRQAAYFAADARRSAEELRGVNADLAYRASHDSLTGLVNRQEFARRLDAATAPGAPRPIGVLYMDLDRFKRINDTLGHTVGDELLRVAAQRIRTRVRPNDVLARLGGDEFTLLLAPPCSEDELDSVASRILQAFEEPFVLFGEPYRVGISIGSSFSAELLSASRLLSNADTALYAAKDEGRGRIRRYHESQPRLSGD